MTCMWQQMRHTAAVTSQQQLDNSIEERIAELNLQRSQDAEHLAPTHSANCSQQAAFVKPSQPKRESEFTPVVVES